MAFWTTFKEQLLALWNRWSIGQRVGFSAAAAACVAAVLGTMIWASQPEYVVIASQLTPQRSAEIVGMLDTEKIGYELNFSGSAVSVASSDVAKARLALQDQLTPEEDRSDEDNSILPFGSPRAEEDRRRSALEKRVQDNIARLCGIRAATVSISRPDSTPFADDQSPVTAAVVIEPKPGETVSTGMAQTIIMVVSKSVPGLTANNIVLTDTNGRQFGGHDGMQSELDSQLAYKEKIEAYLATKAEMVLLRLQGVRGSVQVTVDIDFSKQTRTSNTYDPDTKVKTSESIVNNKQDGGIAPPVGIPGTGSNIVPETVPKNAYGNSTNEQIDTEYENSFINEELHHPGGKIVRLTVAAVVDVQPAAPVDPSAPQTTPTASPLQQEAIEKIVMNAVGFDPLRNDEIQVVLAPLTQLDTIEPATPGFVWQQWQPLMQSVSLGLAATLAFIIGLMLMKRMKPIVITETVGPGIPLADARRLASISEQARANPEVVASILSAWLNEQEKATDPVTAAASGRNSQKSTVTPSSGTGSSIPKSAMPQNGSSNEGRKAA